MTEPLVIALNAGSSSLKVGLYAAEATPRKIDAAIIERLEAGAAGASAALEGVVAKLAPRGGLAAVSAVGHRIVHGGPRFDGPRLVTTDVLEELKRLASLDPDHLPAAIALLEALRAKAPTLRQVACFDTSFHRTMPRVARLLPIPRKYEAQGVQRYGFHGLSYTFLVEELARVAGAPAAHARVVMAHLGSGSSLVALRDGQSVDTTMAFTANSGIPMGTRSGSLDPGVLVHLLRTEHLSTDALDDLLNRHSGMLGVSESSGDMRDLLAREPTDERASDAVALYCHEARKAVGALAATLGGIDTLVFAGGIGENAAPVRARITRGLEHLGVHVDDARNERSAPLVSTDDSPCAVRVIHTDEESIIVRETLRVLGASR